MKINEEFKEIIWQGLWKNNPGLVQLLGLCPLLAVTSTVTNALGLGVATLLVLVCSNATVSAVRQWVPKEVRIPIFGTIDLISLIKSVKKIKVKEKKDPKNIITKKKKKKIQKRKNNFFLNV